MAVDAIQRSRFLPTPPFPLFYITISTLKDCYQPLLSSPPPNSSALHAQEREREREREKMLLGKRARGPMRRTTSMTEFGFELGEPEGGQGAMQREDWMNSAAVVPRGGGGRRRNSGEFVVEMASFLKACGLCKRRLGTGRDIFMYRGDIAFCSLECRQQQMNLDERKEKCSLTSMKKDTPPVATGSESSSNGETIAAA